MKRTAVAVLIVLATASCGRDDTPTDPASADATTLTVGELTAPDPAPTTTAADLTAIATGDTPASTTTTTPPASSAPTSPDSSPAETTTTTAPPASSTTAAPDNTEAVSEANAALDLLDDLLAGMSADIDGLAGDLAAEANATASAVGD